MSNIGVLWPRSSRTADRRVFTSRAVRRLEFTQAGFMQKIILMSVIYATAIIPLLAARDTSARRGLRRAIAWLLAFNVIYLLAVVFLYPRFS